MASQSTMEPDDAEHSPQAPASRRRKVLILAGAAAAAAGLAVAVVYGPSSWRILQERDTTLTPPAQTAGLQHDTSSEAEGTAEYLRTALAAGMRLDDTVGAVYTDPVDPHPLSHLHRRHGGAALARE